MFGHDYLDTLQLGEQKINIRHRDIFVDVLFIDNTGRMQTVLVKIKKRYAILYYNGLEETFKYLVEPESMTDSHSIMSDIICEESSEDLSSWAAELDKIFKEKNNGKDLH